MNAAEHRAEDGERDQRVYKIVNELGTIHGQVDACGRQEKIHKGNSSQSDLKEKNEDDTLTSYRTALREEWEDEEVT